MKKILIAAIACCTLGTAARAGLPEGARKILETIKGKSAYKVACFVITHKVPSFVVFFQIVWMNNKGVRIFIFKSLVYY